MNSLWLWQALSYLWTSVSSSIKKIVWTRWPLRHLKLKFSVVLWVCGTTYKKKKVKKRVSRELRAMDSCFGGEAYRGEALEHRSCKLKHKSQRMSRISLGRNDIQVKKNFPAQGIILTKRQISNDEDSSSQKMKAWLGAMVREWKVENRNKTN